MQRSDPESAEVYRGSGEERVCFCELAECLRLCQGLGGGWSGEWVRGQMFGGMLTTSPG